MLDLETKNRINAARDILVGKVPDPKSQVEQITIALIYKFMDDMDQDAVQLGGKATFFSGDFKQYAWSKIFDPKISGSDLVNTYGDAIQKMNQNPHIPQLFRDMFKNAFLPYRDPETLKSFLKIIDEFEYDHSERLGDAFEYLLSALGSQGEAGQFRTPRHIIDFIVDIVDPQKTESILDPACGTAGFLISSYKHILKHNSKNFSPANDHKTYQLHGVKLEEIIINNKNYSGDKLTSDEKEWLTKNIVGYDISPDMVRLSLVNMYLHGFMNPKISEYDTLTSEDKWGDLSDVILANPPFMSPKGGIRPHKRFTVQSKRSEVLFVDYVASHLRPKGKAGFIVPDGILFNKSKPYVQLRELLIKKGLFAVVSLHHSVFRPYASVKTSIIFLDSRISRENQKVLFTRIDNDGFELGGQRRPIKENDLPDTASALFNFKKSLLENTPCNFSKNKKTKIIGVEKLGSHKSLLVNRYVREEYHERKVPLERIGDLFDIKKGSLQSTKSVEGDYYFITGSKTWSSHSSYTHDCEALVVVVAASGSLGRTHYVNGKFVASDLCLILTPKKDPSKKIDLKVYHAYFNSISEKLVLNLAKGTKMMIGKKELGDEKIMYIPYPEQLEISKYLKSEEKQVSLLQEKINIHHQNIIQKIVKLLG